VFGLVYHLEHTLPLGRRQLVRRGRLGAGPAVLADALRPPALHRARIDADDLARLALAGTADASFVDQAEDHVSFFVGVLSSSSPQIVSSFFLYRLLADNLETFLARVQADDSRGDLPRFVVRELRAFLDCGVLARGFSRVHCSGCGKDALVAHSCKRRGFCPSCGARRMADTAAHLVDRVLPDVPVRQWVLALPHRVRFLCAYDPELCRGVRRVFVRAITSFYKRRARDRGIEEPRTGCIVFTQRFDSALRLNVHFHTLWPDGVFRTPDRLDEEAEFEPLGPPTDADIARLATALRHRVLRYLRKTGKLPADDCDPTDTFDEQPLLATLAAAATRGATVLGPRAGAQTPRLGRGSASGGEFRRGKLCSDCEGFSLHAGVRIPEFCRKRLEKLQPDYDTTGPDRLPHPRHHSRRAPLARPDRAAPPAVR
jgi:hypothetical protein